jgi:diguanylate cyclase (GGDEF)-like protein/PAS domain S-box-containing protein
MGYKKGETVLVVTDEALWNLGFAFYNKIKELGIEVILNSMKTRSINGEEPPAAIAESMKNADIALLITGKSLSHTQARRLACVSDKKVRIASMPGADGTRLEKLLKVDYDEMFRHGFSLSEELKKTKQVEITTAAGTNVSMEITGRLPHVDSGILTLPGAFGNLPAGEVYLAPLEGTTNGTIVIDGSISGIGLLKKPIKITVKNGLAEKIDSEELRKIIDPLGPLARNIAEFGIGTNPNATVIGNILEDEKAINTIHIALGDSISMGGKVKAPCHLDGIILAPSIKLDGKPIPERLIRWYPSARIAKSKNRQKISDTSYSVMEFEDTRSSIGPELFQLLFDNSNDPQYVLDLKNQVFLEANRAFLELSGYSKEELVGKLKSSDLTPPNTRPVLISKQSAINKGIMRERYQFEILAKNGEIKPLELSVHRTKIGDKEVTIGAARDISERLRLEKALREKITEIAFAGNRLLALTEKIKNVPLITAALLKSKTEEELCEGTIKLLCDPEGLAYKNAAIYFLQEGRLKLSKCSKIMRSVPALRRGTHNQYKLERAEKTGLPPAIINIYGSHHFARVARGEIVRYQKDTEILLPLRGLRQIIGVVRIIMDPKEKELMDNNPVTKKSYEDIVETIGSILGLLTESLRMDKILEMQSIMDELTGIYNRRYFERMLKEETERSLRYRRSLSLFLIDLNKFKKINDTAGHNQGDVILSEFAQLLKKHSRKLDVVCRYGGDEFAIILPETNAKGALLKANRLYDHIKDYKFTDMKSRLRHYRITASFGISTVSKERNILSEERLVASADNALYKAKKLKKRQVKSYWL